VSVRPRQHRVRFARVYTGARAYALVFLGALVSVWVASVNLSDPLWIAGVYDDADYDDFIAQSTHASVRSTDRSDHVGLPPVPPLSGLREPAASRLGPPVDAGAAPTMTGASALTRAPPSRVTQA
jgi:hypothetical protein